MARLVTGLPSVEEAIIEAKCRGLTLDDVHVVRIVERIRAEAETAARRALEDALDDLKRGNVDKKVGRQR